MLCSAAFNVEWMQLKKQKSRLTWWYILYVKILGYADDIDIIGLRLSYVAEAYQGIEKAAENLGLQINEAKTKLMVVTSVGLPINNQNLRRRNIQVGERTFEIPTTHLFWVKGQQRQQYGR